MAVVSRYLTITQGNLDNSHMYLTECMDLFPDDVLGGPDESQAVPRTVRVEYGSEVVDTDIVRDKHIFRRRGSGTVGADGAVLVPRLQGGGVAPNQALQQTAGHDSFLGLQALRCPAAAELGRSARPRSASTGGRFGSWRVTAACPWATLVAVRGRGAGVPRRTRRCSRHRPHIGFPRCASRSAAGAAELGRSAAEGFR